jgi:DNA polymerase elongation subunit (family B)
MNTQEYTKEYKKARQLVVDIETMPDSSVIHLLPEPAIDNRLKDPAKIALAEEASKQEQIDKMALSPLTGKIACIGYYHGNNTGLECDFADDEKACLDRFWNKAKDCQLITYNGKSFDIPFIFKRGIILGCEWATIKQMKNYTDRFKSEKLHIDLMTEFCDFGKFEKLDNLARFILKDKGKLDFDVTTIKDLIATEEGRVKLKEYCLQDCKITWRLAKRMGF